MAEVQEANGYSSMFDNFFQPVNIQQELGAQQYEYDYTEEVREEDCKVGVISNVMCSQMDEQIGMVEGITESQSNVREQRMPEHNCLNKHGSEAVDVGEFDDLLESNGSCPGDDCNNVEPSDARVNVLENDTDWAGSTGKEMLVPEPIARVADKSTKRSDFCTSNGDSMYLRCALDVHSMLPSEELHDELCKESDTPCEIDMNEFDDVVDMDLPDDPDKSEGNNLSASTNLPDTVNMFSNECEPELPAKDPFLHKCVLYSKELHFKNVLDEHVNDDDRPWYMRLPGFKNVD